MNDYTELELLSHANAILEVATEQVDLKDVKVYIRAAQHKLELLKEQLGGSE
jgi:hypothetical protein